MAAPVKRLFGLPAKLKENSDYYKYSPYSKNLIAVHEDCLFIWHAVEEHILVITLKEKSSTDDEEPQVLTLSCAPLFCVEELKLSLCGHHLCLSGKKGLLVVELPRRWGSSHFLGPGYEGGKDSVLCKSWKIAQRFLSCNTNVQVCHVAWYPGCANGAHILVLCSDNYLRMYNVTEPQSPVSCIPICGRDSIMSSTLDSSFSRISFPNTAAALGETAVSFDFGPACNPRDAVSKDEEDLIWPIFLLKGNGDVCLINSNLKNIKGRGPRVQGPLTMHPPAEDNYGADACSIACLQTSPPVLVVATCAGIIYHCIALGNSLEHQEQSWNVLDEDQAEMDLYVYESVELSISLTQAAPEDELFSCPIRISLDPSITFRYHCTHSAGVHAVVLPVVPDIEKFASHEDGSVNQESLLDLLESEGQESVVEHLLCTQPFPSAPGNPILGLAMANTIAGSSLITLMSTWEALQLPLGYSYSNLHRVPYLPSDTLDVTPEQTTETDEADNPTDSFLSNCLSSFQCASHTPLLKTDPTGAEPSPQKCIELLSNFTQALREERIQRLQIASTQMQKRVKMLKGQKTQILSQLGTISNDQETLRHKAEELAEKYEDVNHAQQLITQRVECALSLLQRRLPVLSDAEVSMQKELYLIDERLKHLDNLLQQANLKMKFKTDMDLVKKKGPETGRTVNDSLSNSNQMKHVRELIAQQGNSVSTLVKKVNTILSQLGL